MPRAWKPVPVRIEVRYHCPQGGIGYHPRDIQNAIAALKPAIDGMVDAGVIPDDSKNWLTWGPLTLTRRKDGHVPGVDVTVTPIDVESAQ